MKLLRNIFGDSNWIGMRYLPGSRKSAHGLQQSKTAELFMTNRL